MSKNVRTLANIGIGLIVIIVTLIIFFLGYANHPKESIDWAALVFVLISEFALFGGAAIIFIRRSTSSQMLIRLGIVSVLFINWVLTVTISIFRRGIFENNVRSFTITQIIIFAIVLILTILLYVVSISNKEKDDLLINSKLLMRECESLAYSLKANVNYEVYSKLFNKIYEEIKYSDKTISMDKDQIIYNKITELSTALSGNLKEMDAQDITKIADEIVLIIKERNLSVKQLKQGGF